MFPGSAALVRRDCASVSVAPVVCVKAQLSLVQRKGESQGLLQSSPASTIVDDEDRPHGDPKMGVQEESNGEKVEKVAKFERRLLAEPLVEAGKG